MFNEFESILKYLKNNLPCETQIICSMTYKPQTQKSITVRITIYSDYLSKFVKEFDVYIDHTANDIENNLNNIIKVFTVFYNISVSEMDDGKKPKVDDYHNILYKAKTDIPEK